MKTNPKTVTTAASSGQARQQHLQAMLHHCRREMQNELQRRVRRVPFDRPSDGLDETEQAEADVQEHIEVALIQMKGDTLQRVQEALVRLDAGEYGYCVECDGEISEIRLKALPFAVRCTTCEELHERRDARERRFDVLRDFGIGFADSIGT
jgi:DnaK suppressor protein